MAGSDHMHLLDAVIGHMQGRSMLELSYRPQNSPIDAYAMESGVY